jgi:hypothetical protein
MRIPSNANSEVQTAFRELWLSLDRLTGGNLDMKGRRIINTGSPIAGTDLIRKVDVANDYGFDSFYIKLKNKGLDDFPGILRESQPSKVLIVTSTTAPPGTDTGKIFFETDTGVLKFATGSGYTTINYQGISGLYAARPSAVGVSDGVTFYATDLNSSFVVNSGAWMYLAGFLSGDAASRPVLEAGDVGFKYHDTDIGVEIIWDGTAWAAYLVT